MTFGVPGQAQSGEPILEQKQLQEKLDKEFKTIQKHLKNEDVASLKKQIDTLTHDKTIFLFEFTSNVSGVDFPQQRAYFDRTREAAGCVGAPRASGRRLSGKNRKALI